MTKITLAALTTRSFITIVKILLVITSEFRFYQVKYVGMMLVTSGAVLFVIVSVFCTSLLRRYQACNKWYFFYIIAVTDAPSRIIKFTITGFTTQSLCYPQIIHINSVVYHFRASFFVPRMRISS
jgi:hypothetical protein